MKSLITGIVVLTYFFSLAQAPKPGNIPGPNAENPKLVVGIVIDQMRYDYITRYWDKFGNGGFKRLMGEGFNCMNTFYNYVPTYTGPGHASIYTGTTPAVHGIIANNWYSRDKKGFMYCSSDSTVKGVGGSDKSGAMSPKNMLSTTIGDELRSNTLNGSRVFGIALKDRGAILPAGHSANAAYWYDSGTGNWMTSSYYMKELPPWVNEFNKMELPKKYLSQEWKTFLAITEYTASLPDNNPYELPFDGETAPVFPHKVNDLNIQIKNGGLGLIRSTPYGNTLTKEFALTLIQKENLGKGAFTDLLAVSFSSPDYIGHQFGPKSIEVQDCYLRLDKDIEEILLFLDKWIGKQNVLVFLTADHAAVDVPSWLQSMKIPGGYYEEKIIADSLQRQLRRIYNEELVLSVSNYQVFLDHRKMNNMKLDRSQVEKTVADLLLGVPGISQTITATALKNTYFLDKPRNLMQNGYYIKRSGDVLFNFDPNWIEHPKGGTTHGSPYPYDTRVPLLWYGWKIINGRSKLPVQITDLAPTLSMFLNVQMPDGCTGNVIPFLTKQ